MLWVFQELRDCFPHPGLQRSPRLVLGVRAGLCALLIPGCAGVIEIRWLTWVGCGVRVHDMLI